MTQGDHGRSAIDIVSQSCGLSHSFRGTPFTRTMAAEIASSREYRVSLIVNSNNYRCRSGLGEINFRDREFSSRWATNCFGNDLLSGYSSWNFWDKRRRSLTFDWSTSGARRYRLFRATDCTIHVIHARSRFNLIVNYLRSHLRVELSYFPTPLLLLWISWNFHGRGEKERGQKEKSNCARRITRTSPYTFGSFTFIQWNKKKNKNQLQ